MSTAYEYVVVGLGALGSSVTHELARRGNRVLGLERFGLGHDRGASHDTSRILRHSYHTPAYVRLTFAAYEDWARLERDSGRQLVSVVGGLDLFPPEPAIPLADYRDSMLACDVDFEELSAEEIRSRWPQFRLPAGTVGLYQGSAAIVPAAVGTRTMAEQARAHGAELLDHTPVVAVRDRGAAGVEVGTRDRTYTCDRVVVCADGWTNDVLAEVGWKVPLEVTLEQVSYFEPSEPEEFAPGRLPLWIWMDDPSFYGFPCYGEPTVKAAQDCGGPPVDPDRRTHETDPDRLGLLADFLARTLPGSGPHQRSVRCLYTLTPDRDFVVGPVPGHENVLVGMGAAHGFKFAPTLGRLLADLTVDGTTSTDVSAFGLDRPALTDPGYSPHWLV